MQKAAQYHALRGCLLAAILIMIGWGSYEGVASRMETLFLHEGGSMDDSNDPTDSLRPQPDTPQETADWQAPLLKPQSSLLPPFGWL